MTTRVHVVNFGPEAVEVQVAQDAIGANTGPATKLYAQMSADYYVYDGQVLIIQERKQKQENT